MPASPPLPPSQRRRGGTTAAPGLPQDDAKLAPGSRRARPKTTPGSRQDDAALGPGSAQAHAPPAPGSRQGGSSRGRRGPKPKPLEELREHCVSVRLNPAELERLDALRGRLQRGHWLREAALGRGARGGVEGRTIPELNREAWTKLGRLSANLNQLTRAVNEGRAAAGLAGVLATTRDLLRVVRAQLLGVAVGRKRGGPSEGEDS